MKSASDYSNPVGDFPTVTFHTESPQENQVLLQKEKKDMGEFDNPKQEEETVFIILKINI